MAWEEAEEWAKDREGWRECVHGIGENVSGEVAEEYRMYGITVLYTWQDDGAKKTQFRKRWNKKKEHLKFVH